MKGGVWPNVRLSVIALAIAGTLAGTLGPTLAHAQPSADRAASERVPKPPNSKANRHNPNVTTTALRQTSCCALQFPPILINAVVMVI